MNNDFTFVNFHSLNGYKLSDLLITYSRFDISNTLREMAKSAQEKIRLNPSNSDCIKYAESLAWHYVKLRDADHLDKLIEKIKTNVRKHNDNNKIAVDFDKRFCSFVTAIEGLEKYTIRKKPHYMGIRRSEDIASQVSNASLSPSCLANLTKDDNLNISDWLDGAIKLLKTAPWNSGHGNYITFKADPEQRIEFEAACTALIPEANNLKSIVIKVNKINMEDYNIQEACDDFQQAWASTLNRREIPIYIWEDAIELLDKKDKKPKTN